MTMVDLLNTPNLSDPQLSSDGRQLVYVLGEADWDANRQVSHIWRIDVGLTRRHTTHQRARQRGQPAMVARRKADCVSRAAQRLPADSPHRRHRRRGTSVDGARDIRAGGGRSLSEPVEHLLVARRRLDLLSGSGSEDGRREETATGSKTTCTRSRRITSSAISGESSVADRTEQRLTDGDLSVLDYELSHDGTKVVFHRAPNPRYGFGDQGEIWVMDATGEVGRFS